MPSLKNLHGLIIGCGSIGQRHLHNLKKIGLNNISIYDMDKKKVDKISLKYKTKKFFDLDDALSSTPDFSFICTFPSSHIPIAKKCVKANSHIFIEKPISSELNQVEGLLNKAKSQKLQVAVGYNMRFDKGLSLVKKKLQRLEISTPLSIFVQWGHNIKFWRPGLEYKNHYVLKKGGGIILDDSHEYDYLRWLLNDEVKSVFCQTSKSKSIKTKTESNASIILKFKSGIVANLMIDYVRPTYERECHIIGEKGDIKWKVMPLTKGAWKKFDVKNRTIVTTNYLNGRTPQQNNFTVKDNEVYMDEVKSFLKSIEKNERPFVDGWDGLRTLKIGVAALKSAKTNKVINLT